MPRDDVTELRLVVTAEDFDAAVHLYRDVLGLRPREAFSSRDGRVVILEAGRATLELADQAHAEFVDEVEVGRRVAGHIRVALRVADVDVTTQRLQEAGAELVAPPTPTPWGSSNSRLRGPAGLQLTLFGPAAEPAADPDP
jgi:lactoylglutathione lyase